MINQRRGESLMLSEGRRVADDEEEEDEIEVEGREVLGEGDDDAELHNAGRQ